MKEIVLCSHCGARLTDEDLTEFEGAIYCHDCLEALTTVCDCCGARIRRDAAEGDNETDLCHHCYDYNYTTCEDCGALLHTDDACYDDSDYPYCHNCYEKLQQALIKSYNYKPEPIFFGSGTLFMGVELEIDNGGDDSDNADTLLMIANRTGEHVYCKHDGSLSDGFEIVSHPMTLEYHTNEMNWLDIFENAVLMEYRSHQTDTCGLHIHVNRSAFGATIEQQYLELYILLKITGMSF